jgi:dephospho-CoA kinase
MNNKLVLGITGGSGSGKSQVCKLLASMGACIIDADEIGHAVTQREDVLKEITVEFGREVLNSDGSLNRKALGQIVFSSKSALEALNIITHSLIAEETKKILSESDAEVICIDAALLQDAKMKELCSFVIAVVAPINMRLKRIMQRDNLTEEQAMARIHSQMTDAQYAHSADFVILNNGNVENLNRRVIEIFETIREE